MKDFYAKYTNDDLWCIREEGFHKTLQEIRESQLSIGNGFLGARAILEEIPPGAKPGTFVTGVYDSFSAQVAELVNLPNPFNFKFTVNGEKLGLLAMDVTEHKRLLNMQDGVLVRKTIYVDSKKRRYSYQSIRFLSMDDKNIGVMQIALTALDGNATIELHTGIDTSVQNSGTFTEGRKRHFRIKELAQEDNAGYLAVQTYEKKHQFIYRSGFYYQQGGKKIYASDNAIELKLKKNQPLILTKIFYLTAFENDAVEFKKQKKHSRIKFRKLFKTSFQSILWRHTEKWHKIWDIADISVDGTASIQKNLRFNIYHMIICGYYDQGFSSIGARTLSGEGYRGHIFWDAEIFMLPFYAYIMPDVAKNMLLYRYNRLPKARKIAKEKGFKGAMFPWESAGSGDEETPQWAKNLDGTIIKIKTNELEHHITADLAYAVNQYYEITGDKEFMREAGYELIIEAARFWASRVTLNRKKQYEIRDVIGPDEFHEHVHNNAYTNILAKWNLLVAYKIFDDIKKNDRKTFSRLQSRIGLSSKEARQWKIIIPRIKLNMRKDKVIEQFDGFFKKKHIEIINYDENRMPLLPEGIKVKDYNKTQFVKQADVLMFLYLLSDIFNQKTKESNFYYYVDRTLHKSSLSPAIHALVATEVGALSRAYQFFNVALRADISNLHGNTHEGIHAASLGGTWQAVVFGFAGIRSRGDTLKINPHMPITWNKIQCTLNWQGHVLTIEVTNAQVRLKVVSKTRKPVNVEIFGKKYFIKAKKQLVVQQEKKILKKRDYYL